MKLFQYNQSPIDLNPEQIDRIVPMNEGTIKVFLVSGKCYLGQMIKL